jgi:hypothetical protein
MTYVDLQPIVHLPRDLTLAGFEGRIPNPRKAYALALGGDIPAEMVGGRWLYRRDKLTEIAAVLGLTACARSEAVSSAA